MADDTYISSLQNQRIKDAVKLRDRRARNRQRRFLIDGLRELERALAADVTPHEAFVNFKRGDATRLRPLLEQLQSRGASISEVSPPVWEKLAFGDRDDGLVVVASCDVPTAETLSGDGVHPIVVLDRVEKPGNIGAVLRTADAAGASALALADPRTDLFNPNVIRASLGTVFTVPVHVDSEPKLIARIKALGLPIFVTQVDAQRELFDVDFTVPCAIVLGNEAEGVSAAWRAAQTLAFRLPMAGAADSLNVSTTAAIVLYESVRQMR